MISRPPLFVLGCPRSGTTLLSELLEPLPWGAPVETHFISKYARKLDSFGDLRDDRNVTRLVERVLAERPVMQWDLGLTALDIVDRMPERTFRCLVDTVCMARFSELGKTSWGDKTPHYVLELETLVELFPDSNYLFIVRDGRDVALSLMGRSWGPNNILAASEYWRDCNSDSPSLERLRDSGRLHTIRYEDLLANPSPTMQGVFDFLGVGQDISLIENHLKKIRPNNYAKWKKALSARQRQTFEAVAGKHLEKFDYEVEFSNPKVGIARRWFWRLHDKALHFLNLVKMNTVDAIRIRYFGMQPFAD